MIDFHSHIIPNIDDGSRNVEETFELLKQAQDAGFSGVILTSHYVEDYYDADENERKKWLDVLKKNMYKENLKLNLYLGNEIYANPNISDLIKHRKASSINQTRYVLFEYPMNAEPFNLMDTIYNLQENKYIPVLAHPERYVYFQNNLEKIYDLIQKGVLMQSNYGSILGLYGKKAKLVVEKLLENNMVHFLGSDVHRKNTVYLRVPEALEKIELIIGKEKLEEITQKNPSLVLKNKQIEIREPSFPKFSFKEKFLMKLYEIG